MKKIFSAAVIAVVIAGFALSSCEKKSDSEKALDKFKKDVNSMTK